MVTEQQKVPGFGITAPINIPYRETMVRKRYGLSGQQRAVEVGGKKRSWLDDSSYSGVLKGRKQVFSGER